MDNNLLTQTHKNYGLKGGYYTCTLTHFFGEWGLKTALWIPDQLINAVAER